jgi:ribulose bisphosphate carboxylase small subunit
MNKVQVRANSNRLSDQGAHLELFAQENGGVWVRVTVIGAKGGHRSTSVIVSPPDVITLSSWLSTYTAKDEENA